MDHRVGEAKRIAKEAKSFREGINFIVNNYPIILKEIDSESSNDLGLPSKDNSDKFIYVDFKEKFLITNSDKFIYVDNKFFEIIKSVEWKEHCYKGEIFKLEDDLYHFNIKYFDGGSCFEEMFEEALKKSKN